MAHVSLIQYQPWEAVCCFLLDIMHCSVHTECVQPSTGKKHINHLLNFLCSSCMHGILPHHHLDNLASSMTPIMRLHAASSEGIISHARKESILYTWWEYIAQMPRCEIESGGSRHLFGYQMRKEANNSANILSGLGGGGGKEGGGEEGGLDTYTLHVRTVKA